MERGKSKSETGKEHLERNDFIIEKQKREAEHAEIRRKEAETECEQMEDKVEQTRQTMQSLDTQISTKQSEVKSLDAELEARKKAKEKADKENANAILDKAASFFGKGELAEKKREVVALKSENENLKAKHSKELTLMRKHYEGLVVKETGKNVAPYKAKLQEMKTLLDSLRSQNVILANAKQNFGRKLEDTKRAYSLVVKLLGRLMSQISEVFKAAITGIINFAKAGVSYKHRDVFMASEAAAIKQTMNDFTPLTDDRQLVGKILVDYAQYEGKLTDQEANRSQRQVDDVATGRYDHIIERGVGEGVRI